MHDIHPKRDSLSSRMKWESREEITTDSAPIGVCDIKLYMDVAMGAKKERTTMIASTKA